MSYTWVKQGPDDLLILRETGQFQSICSNDFWPVRVLNHNSKLARFSYAGWSRTGSSKGGGAIPFGSALAPRVMEFSLRLVDILPVIGG